MAALSVQPPPQPQVKVHLHGSTDLARTFVTALWVDDPAPEIIVYGEQMYRRDWAESQRLRRPTYIRATWLITGPTAQRHGLAGLRGA